jgi:hypothetical protein
MTSITIPHYPDIGFECTTKSSPHGFYSSGAGFKIDMADEVLLRLKPGETLTNSKALAIFQDIKTSSEVKAFFTHPGFVIPISLTGAALSISLGVLGSFLSEVSAIAALALKVFAIILGSISGAVFGFSLYSMQYDALLNLSHAYRDMGHKACEFIETIQKAGPEEIAFSFASY